MRRRLYCMFMIPFSFNHSWSSFRQKIYSDIASQTQYLSHGQTSIVISAKEYHLLALVIVAAILNPCKLSIYLTGGLATHINKRHGIMGCQKICRQSQNIPTKSVRWWYLSIWHSTPKIFRISPLWRYQCSGCVHRLSRSCYGLVSTRSIDSTSSSKPF